jgi:hypothetical protein
MIKECEGEEWYFVYSESEKKTQKESDILPQGVIVLAACIRTFAGGRYEIPQKVQVVLYPSGGIDGYVNGHPGQGLQGRR